VDASAFVDLLCGTEVGEAVEHRLRGQHLVAPAHFDAEILTALGRLQRVGELSEAQVARRVELLADSPVDRRLLAPLVRGAWERRHNLRLVDALYVELAAQLGDLPLITTDSGIASACPSAKLVAG
jgi:predicted nucleic acid-binding protein